MTLSSIRALPDRTSAITTSIRSGAAGMSARLNAKAVPVAVELLEIVA